MNRQSNIGWLSEEKLLTEQGREIMTYLKEVMDAWMLKFLQAHVIAHVYVLILDDHLETFPSQIFVLNDVRRRLGRARRSRLGQRSSGRRSLGRSGLNWSGRVHINYLDGRLRLRRFGLNHLGRALLNSFVSTIGEPFQINVLGQKLPFLPSRWTYLSLRTFPFT